MKLGVVGLNHKTMPSEARRRFVIGEESLRGGLPHVRDSGELTEAAVLSTCNRTEVYAVTEGESLREEAERLFLTLSGNHALEREYCFYYEGTECIRHLFRVAAGLDSMVIGESQILNQVKKAYTEALSQKATRTVLNTLFHRAIRVGKRVRAETSISEQALSVSYVAVKTAKRILGGLEGKEALLIGAGEAAELLGRHLMAGGLSRLLIANRHVERAEALADKLGGKTVPFADMLSYAKEADLLVTAAGATQYMVKEWDMRRLMVERRHRPLLAVDIAIPFDVEPTVRNIRNVTLCNMDDLQVIVENHLDIRKEEGRRAEVIVEEELRSLEDRLVYLRTRPAMAALSDKGEEIRRREYGRVLSKCPNLSERERKYIDDMSRRIVRKLLREPMTALSTAAGTERECSRVSAATGLFGLEREEGGAYER